MPLRTATLKTKHVFTHDVIELSFETPDPFEFLAGQFVTYKIADRMPPCFRAYSISCAPTEPKPNGNIIATCLKVVDGGRGSNWLNSLNIGDKIEFMGPSGKLIFHTAPEKTGYFIATGTGITPLKSMIEDELINKDSKQKLHLLFGLRHSKDVFYRDHFNRLAQKYENFTVEYTLSKPEDENWTGSVGRVTDILDKNPPNPHSTEVYICGLKAMINDVTLMLKTKGFSETSIKSEKYD